MSYSFGLQSCHLHSCTDFAKYLYAYVQTITVFQHYAPVLKAILAYLPGLDLSRSGNLVTCMI